MRFSFFALAAAAWWLQFADNTSLQAQSQEADEAPEAAAIVLSDEPATIDPAQFFPPALAASATVDLSGASLGDLFDWLREEQGLVVLVDGQALESERILLADRADERLDDSPIYFLLNRLRQRGLAWYYEDDILFISSPETVELRQATLTYNVGDLFDAGYDAGMLAEIMTGSVKPRSWDEAGGEGVLNFLGDVMFVGQTDALQREIQGLLAALRNHGRRTFSHDPPQHARLRDALERPVDVDFRAVPLDDAVARLAEQTGVDVRLDRAALRDVGVRERHPVSLTLADRQLGTVLDALLLEADLTWVLRDGVLWITSPEAEESNYLKTAVYDVRDLCRDHGESESLVDAIIAQASPLEWKNVGGQGDVESALPGVLVVRNRERILHEVLDLLETYRTALRQSKPRVQPGPNPDEVLTVYYRMNTAVARDYFRVLPQLVHPDSWKNEFRPEAPGVRMLVASNPDFSHVATAVNADDQDEQREAIVSMSVLIITQTRAAHGEIKTLLRRIELGDDQFNQLSRPRVGLGGGAGGGLGGAGGSPFGGGGFGGGFFSIEPGPGEEADGETTPSESADSP